MTNHRILQGDVMAGLAALPDESVHCVITSPPYWDLRDYSMEGQIGLEETPEEYVARLVEVFREVKRVLRKDGTLWLNLGGKYTSGGRTHIRDPDNMHKPVGPGARRQKTPPGLKPKDLVGIPWLVAFALQRDGWWLRQDIVWAKPNPMRNPAKDRFVYSHEYIFLMSKSARYYFDHIAVRVPISPLTKPVEVYTGTTVKEYPISEAVKPVQNASETKRNILKSMNKCGPFPPDNLHKQDLTGNPTYYGFNERTKERGPNLTAMRLDVWCIPPQPCRDSHFATFPELLVELCLLPGTSERGCCPVCGAPWTRILEPSEEYKKRLGRDWLRKNEHPEEEVLTKGMSQEKTIPKAYADYVTVGWRPTCTCGHEETIPCTVLDPFGGSGRVAKVARDHKRNNILIELNPEYVKIAKKTLRANEQLIPGVVQVEVVA